MSNFTKDEIECIRIHMNAFKEKLCNMGWWDEAEEYQTIVDKLDDILKAESVIRRKDCDYCKHWHGLKRDGRYWCSKHSLYMETGCEEGERKS